jgi:hypothetical protein
VNQLKFYTEDDIKYLEFMITQDYTKKKQS